MKAKVLLVLFSIVFWASAQAVSGYKAGDKLNVVAKSGLTLRANPGSKGKKKSTLAYGTEVTVLAEGLRVTPHEVLEFKGFTIDGFWVKVKAGSEEGWVFDGYLTKLKVDNGSQEAKGASADRDMFDALYSMTSPRKGDRKETQKDGYTNYTQMYEDGTKLTVARYEGGSSRTLTFKKGISQEEAYLWGRNFWFENGEVASLKYNASTKHLRANGKDTDPKAMRIIPNGSQWEAKFEYAD
jgi:Bacterial SH3 domain